jgi:thioredoxin reductase
VRKCEVAIIGAGPAGVAAAIQLSRYGVNTALFEKDSVGGLIRNANRIENYPGFPNGLSGPRFVRLLEEHLQRLGVETISENIENLSFDGDSFALRSENGLTMANRVIIASGTIPIPLLSPQIARSLTNRIFYEVYPLTQHKNKTIAIIGGGDATFDYGLNLARHNDVSILIRDGRAKCLPLLLERSKENDRIRVQFHTILESVEESGDDIQLRFRRTDNSDTFQLHVDYFLIAIGRRPNLDFIDDGLRNRMNDLIDDGKLYMIGDVGNGLYRQATIAAGDGVRAAMKIFRSLTGERE